MHKLRTAALSLAVVAVGAAWYFRRQTMASQAMAVDLARKTAGLKPDAARVESSLTKSTQQAASGANSKQPNPARSTRSLRAKTWLDQLDSSPRLQNLALKIRRASEALQYAPLFRALGLSPAQIDQFENNLQKLQADEMDVQAIIDSKGIDPDDPAIAKWQNQSNSAYAAAQSSLLGEQGYQALLAFNQNLGARSVVNSIAGVAAVAGIPFSPEQTAQLQAAVIQAEGTTGDDSSIDWDRVDQQASAFLTPNQFDLFSTGEFSGGPEGHGGRFLHQLGKLVTQDELKDSSAPAPPTR